MPYEKVLYLCRKTDPDSNTCTFTNTLYYDARS